MKAEFMGYIQLGSFKKLRSSDIHSEIVLRANVIPITVKAHILALQESDKNESEELKIIISDE